MTRQIVSCPSSRGSDNPRDIHLCDTLIAENGQGRSAFACMNLRSP